MAKKNDLVSAEDLSQSIIRGMQEKKGREIVVLNLKNIKNAIADYFVICTGTSDTHIDSITDSVEKEVHTDTNQHPWRKEGHQNKEWILLDYVDVVVHVFKKESRKFYALEDLWGDAVASSISEEA
jgi:ribosome-associated protein